MRVQLATPERIVFDGVANDIVIEAEKGQLNILDRHTDMVSFVRPGPMLIREASGTRKFQLGEGVLKIEKDKLSVLSPKIEEVS